MKLSQSQERDLDTNNQFVIEMHQFMQLQYAEQIKNLMYANIEDPKIEQYRKGILFMYNTIMSDLEKMCGKK